MECLYTLLAFALAFIIAQVWKMVSGLVTGREQNRVLDFKAAVGFFFQSGGMPSGHTASLTAAAVYLGLTNGFGSGLFALAVSVWIIVVYDAIHVRYAVGIQGEALNKLLKQAKMKELPVEHGHNLMQVVVGALIGVGVGLLMFWLTAGVAW